MYDTIIIGGGVSGIMAAVAASENKQKVLLIEKNKQLGKKLLISGGGRCNVTNNLPYEDIIQNIPGNGKFLYGPFSIFDNQSIIQFIESHGVKLKEEDHGRMFPVSNKAKDVLQVFLNCLDNQHVEILLNTEVKEILHDNASITGVKLTDGKTIKSHNIIITTGGKSVPHTGSTGDGFKFAKNLGHSVTNLFPTEVPILSNEPFIKSGDLKGLSLKNVKLSVLKKNGKPRISHQMDMLFAHFGITGPAALRCSQFVIKELEKQKTETVMMELDYFPEFSSHDLRQKIEIDVKANKDKAVHNVLKQFIENRYVDFMFNHLKLDKTMTGHNFDNESKNKILNFLKSFQFKVTGTQPIEKSFVTGGGVHLKEIDPKTMESKIIKGLHFAGEVLDIHGYTGGYNITSALVTGYVAGQHAGQNTN